MQAIETKWLSPTNTQPSRIVAKCSARRVTVCWDHAHGVDENHRRAAMHLAKLLGWAGEWVGGGKADQTGSVFVNATWARPNKTACFTIDA